MMKLKKKPMKKLNTNSMFKNKIFKKYIYIRNLIDYINSKKDESDPKFFNM